MKVLLLSEVLTFYCIPRIYPKIGDVLSLSLRDEMTSEIINPVVTFLVDSDKLAVTITNQPSEFSAQKKYEISLSNNGNVIYLGKMIILESGTDIQNYEYSTQSTARFTY